MVVGERCSVPDAAFFKFTYFAPESTQIAKFLQVQKCCCIKNFSLITISTRKGRGGGSIFPFALALISPEKQATRNTLTEITV